MALIEWTRLSGESIEDTIAMLLCAENFEATQIRPGHGDGGIDIFVANANDLSEREIYQVKRYAVTLTSSQKRKIARSLARVVETARDQGWEISAWWLVLPLNPTPNNLQWFADLTKEHDFPCHWVGLNRIEFLAAKHPYIVDYYLRDGKERLQKQTDRLANIITGRASRKEGDAVHPIDIVDDLRDIYRALNQYDPHYRYEISMTAEPPGDNSTLAVPGLVAISSRGSDDGWINVSIIARSRAAFEARPVTCEFIFRAPTPGDPSHDVYDKFVNYGSPVSLPLGYTKVKLDLPGGLGTDTVEAAISIGPATPIEQTDVEREIVVAAMSEENSILAEIILDLTEVTVGHAGGRRTVWRDRSGFITFEILAKKFPDLTLNITVSVNAAGRRPDEISESLNFLANMHIPNTLALSQAFGPRQFSRGTVTGLRERDRDIARMAKISQALATIQAHTSTRLLFPSEVTSEQAQEIIRAAQVLTGEPVIATWGQIEIIRDTVDELDYKIGTEVDLRAIRDIQIRQNGASITVGKEMILMKGIVKELTQTTVILEPGDHDNNVNMVRFDGEGDDGRVHSRPAQPS